MQTKIGLPSPMRDGTVLRYDLYRPDHDKPLPAILMRTPYGKENIRSEWVYDIFELYTGAGYNVIIQDVRGAGASDGTMKPSGINDYEDGYDSVEWLASQPWCDGNVGMFGLSFFGFTQLAAASMVPPHLKAICPFQNSSLQPFSGSDQRVLGVFHLNWLYGQALRNLDRNKWPAEKTQAVRAKLEQNLSRLPELLFRLPELLFRLPLRETPAVDVPEVPLLKDFIELVDGLEDDGFWKKIHRPTDFTRMETPMFHLSGWFDLALDGTIGNYHEALARSKESVRRAQKLVIGPWVHGGGLSNVVDGTDFGPENSGEGQQIQQVMLAWFDRWLKGIDNGIMDKPPVRYYVLGANIWREADQWPPADSSVVPYYLHSGGHANTLGGDGVLSAQAPGKQPEDRFTYDPAHPFPSDLRDADGHMIMADQRAVETRDDVLVFTTPDLKQNTEVAGCVRARLFASSTAPDTDFTCRLLDVAPDGSAKALLSGIVRAKFREGTPARLIEPGKVYEYTVELGNIGIEFVAGHRIRLEVSSSLYPKFDRNLNTGEPLGKGRECKKAVQTVLHSEAMPSALLLPIRKEK